MGLRPYGAVLSHLRPLAAESPVLCIWGCTSRSFRTVGRIYQRPLVLQLLLLIVSAISVAGLMVIAWLGSVDVMFAESTWFVSACPRPRASE